jgi:hypothetical protein
VDSDLYGSLAIKWMRAIREKSRRDLAREAGLSERRLLAIEYGAPATPEELRAIWTVLAEGGHAISKA